MYVRANPSEPSFTIPGFLHWTLPMQVDVKINVWKNPRARIKCTKMMNGLNDALIYGVFAVVDGKIFKGLEAIKFYLKRLTRRPGSGDIEYYFTLLASGIFTFIQYAQSIYVEAEEDGIAASADSVVVNIERGFLTMVMENIEKLMSLFDL